MQFIPNDSYLRNKKSTEKKERERKLTKYQHLIGGENPYVTIINDKESL